MEMLLSAELLLQPRERLMEQYILFCAYLLSPATKHSFYTELLFPPNIFWKKTAEVSSCLSEQASEKDS